MMGPWIKNGIYLGEGFESARHLALFGSASLAKDELKSHFPDFNFSFLKQVHGPRVVLANPEQLVEADGQITRTPNVALVIQTADCVPVLMGNDSEICALHAGWRGAAARIVEAAASQLNSAPTWVYLGPHIQFKSFEIGRDVAEQLMKSAPNLASDEWIFAHTDPGNCYFNLDGLLRAQIQACFPKTKLWTSHHNTLTDSRYHSFRRDKPDQGRQYSFVVMKE